MAISTSELGSYCASCGAALPSTAGFCQACGAPRSAGPAPAARALAPIPAPAVRQLGSTTGRAFGFALQIVFNAIGIVAAAYFLGGIHWGQVDYGLGDLGRYLALLLVAACLAVMNTSASLVGAVKSGSAPMIVVNVLVGTVVLSVMSFIPVLGFSVNGLQTALLAAIVVAVVGFVVSLVFPKF